MLTGHCFKRLRPRRPTAGELDEADERAFLQRICDHIVKQFTRMTHLTAVAIPVDLKGLEDTEEPAPPPAHPECVDFARTDYCRESWQLHLAKLSQQPATHWHECDYGRLCAVVPLVCHDEVLALFKLACPESVAEPDFESYVELLDILVKHTAATNAATLSRLLPPKQSDGAPDAQSPPAQERGDDSPQSPSHPHVLRALEYVEHSLSDRRLTVRHVADVLGIHPDYLANLFSKEVGQRLSRHIAARRIERAKNLLATTSWRVTRIAHEAGFANPKWFYHVFRTHTGLTPSGYRCKATD